jgi:hypothetical protein
VARGLRRRRLNELVAAGVLAEEPHRSLRGLIIRFRSPERDPAPRLDAERRLRAAVAEPPAEGAPTETADERTAALAALVYVARLGDHVFGAEYRGDVEQRLSAYAAASWATPAVRSAVRAAYAGMMTAAPGRG